MRQITPAVRGCRGAPSYTRSPGLTGCGTSALLTLVDIDGHSLVATAVYPLTCDTP